MKALLIFLGVFTFVTQAHSDSLVKDDLKDLSVKRIPLKIVNESNRNLCVTPVLEGSDLLARMTTNIQIKPGNTIEIDPATLGFENLKIAGFTVSIDGIQERYVPGAFKSSVRFTDLNLKQFFKD